MKESLARQQVTGLLGIKWLAWDDKTWLVLLASLAILVRLGYVLIAGKSELTWGDEFTYDQLARNILDQGCFCFVAGQPSVWRAPLYAVILAAFYALLGHHYMPILVFQAIVGGLGAPLLAQLGKQLSGSMLVGVLAGAMFAVQPLIVFATGLLYTETLYFLLLFALALAWLKLMDEPRNWLVIAVGSGALLGLSNLMKPNLIFLPIWLFVWLWVVLRRFSRAAVMTIWITLGMVVIMAPWIARNYLVTGKFVPVSLSGNIAFYQGNNSQAQGGGIDEVKYVDPLPGLSETEKAAVYWQWGVDWIRTHPAEFARLVPLKLYRFFSPLETSVQGTTVTPIDPVIYAGFGLFYLLAIIGMVATARQWRIWLLPYMLIAYPALLTVVFYGGTRYGLVTQPFIMLFAAEGIVVALSRMRTLTVRG